MGLFEWWTGRGSGDGRIRKWRNDWAAAASQPTAEQIEWLSARLQELGLSDDDVEIELEMLDALWHVAALRSEVALSGLPTVDTGHRIAGADRCHFSAPASMPEDPAQPAGRLLLTSARAAFAGGTGSRTVPWRAIGDALQQERDVLLIRIDREQWYRFRCNSYADALSAAFIARRLIAARKTRI